MWPCLPSRRGSPQSSRRRGFDAALRFGAARAAPHCHAQFDTGDTSRPHSGALQRIFSGVDWDRKYASSLSAAVPTQSFNGLARTGRKLFTAATVRIVGDRPRVGSRQAFEEVRFRHRRGRCRLCGRCGRLRTSGFWRDRLPGRDNVANVHWRIERSAFALPMLIPVHQRGCCIAKRPMGLAPMDVSVFALVWRPKGRY
jgi:hypothetical protein